MNLSQTETCMTCAMHIGMLERMAICRCNFCGTSPCTCAKLGQAQKMLIEHMHQRKRVRMYNCSTVKPLKRGYFGTMASVLSLEVALFLLLNPIRYV